MNYTPAPQAPVFVIDVGSERDRRRQVANTAGGVVAESEALIEANASRWWPEYRDIMERAAAEKSEPGDAARLAEIRVELGITADHLAEDLRWLRHRNEWEPTIAEAEAELARQPSPAEIMAELDSAERELKLAVWRALEPKRRALRRLADRADAVEAVASARATLHSEPKPSRLTRTS